MKHRKAANIITITLVSLGILFIVGLRLVDVIAKSTIDSEISAILGVETSFSGVNLGVLTSKSSFTGITIANPPGFKADSILTVDRVEIDVGIATLMSDNIDIPEVILKGLTFDLEQVDKTINLEVVIENIQKYVADQPPTASTTELELQVIQVENLRLIASGDVVTVAGGHLDTKIPDFKVTNIGTQASTHGMSSQFISVLTHAVLAQAFKNPINGLSNVTMGSLKNMASDLPLLPVNVIKDGLQSIGDLLDGGGDSAKPKKSEDEPAGGAP
jgi:uncharacterized protein involved in outer membrane biogenesis